LPPGHPEEAGELNPIMSTEGFLGGMWADREGYLDTTGTVHAYAKAAKKRGATFYRAQRSKAEQTPGGRLEGRHRQGHDHLRTRGQRRRSLGQAGGPHGGDRTARLAAEAPLPDLRHDPEAAALDFEVPMTVDLEGFTYLRQDQKGVLLGIYEINHQHWAMDGAPWDYGMELFQEQTDRIENELTNAGFERYPAAARWASRPGSTAPSPSRPTATRWSARCRQARLLVACAVMAGFLQGGGVGKTLAEWMIHGEPEADAWSMDVARYGPGPRTSSTSARPPGSSIPAAS
jgi:dimethylglycine dehydrogenase